eukprot:153718_1
MAARQPSLTDPDKLGVLIQCRQKMDALKLDTLKVFANSIISLLPPKQIKKLLFVGLNSIKNDIEYHELFKIKSVISTIIEQAQQSKDKNKTKSKSMSPKQPILKIPKDASLSRVIPTDIIRNSICQYLKMSSLTQLARCDRRLSVIAHTPASINNLQHRYDPYQYAPHSSQFVIDGHYFLHKDMHRFQNVQQLSIYVDTLIDFNVFNACRKVKHLSIYDWPFGDTNNFDLTDMALLPLLQNITWSNLCDFPFFLSFLDQYKTAQKPNENTLNSSKYFTDIIYNLQEIEFVQCDFEEIDYYSYDDGDIVPKSMHMLQFILPQQPNNLQVLKLENSYCSITNVMEGEIDDADQTFNNLKRIKESLTNLKGFCCSTVQTHDNYFYEISVKILSHLSCFKRLQSIHTHNTELLGLYLHDANIPTLCQITELCITVPSGETGLALLRNLRDWTPNVQKICLVFDVDHEKKDYLLKYVPMIQNILKFAGNLRLFCIVTKMEDELLEVDNTADAEHCDKVLDILIQFGLCLKKSFQNIMNCYRSEASSQVPLIFKFHIKSSHYYYNTKCKMKDSFRFQGLSDMVQHLIMNYLMAFPMGHIQFKMSWNIEDYNWISNALQYALKQTDILFDVDIKNGGNLNHIKTDHNPGCCYDDMDYMQFAIGARIKSIKDKSVEYHKRWKVDCQYCCNTPWI